jgi:hypothetical protein
LKIGRLYFPVASLDECAIEIDAAIEKGPGQRDCVGMERRDEIGSGRKVLGTEYTQWT